MVLLEHVRFHFELELVNDCHIGDGGSVPLKEMRPNAQREKDPEVATLARDHLRRPCIPATALKGAIKKALSPVLAQVEIERLFGRVSEEEAAGSAGSQGLFSFYAAPWRECSRQAGDLPLWCPPGPGDASWPGHSATWIKANVAIDRATGATDNQKLYLIEMLPAGSRFLVEGIYFGTLEAARSDLRTLLAPLAGEGGLALGSGGKLVLGAARLSPATAHMSETRFDSGAGRVITKEAPPLEIVALTSRRRFTLDLDCPGPYASVDPDATGRSNAANYIAALRRDRDTPVIHSSSLMGALRARAAWLAALEGLGEDERFRKPTSWVRPSDLTPTERLFGVSGWRGLLRITGIVHEKATARRELTSIALDRFSGAVLDGAVFQHEVFTGVRLFVHLTVDERCDDTWSFPTRDDRKLLNVLLDDLDADILPLGHATNRGFGWFSVSVRRGQHAA